LRPSFEFGIFRVPKLNGIFEIYLIKEQELSKILEYEDFTSASFLIVKLYQLKRLSSS